ncbi:MAG: hypothetical protein Q9209_000959 [Squamulea sp. 1 TL-2023]
MEPHNKPDYADDGIPLVYADEHGIVLDMSAPRRAGEPQPGPWHRIMFDAMGGPFRCAAAKGSCQAGGDCDLSIGQKFIDMAAEKGHRGPSDPNEVRQVLRPFFVDIKRRFVDEVAAFSPNVRVILPGGGEGLRGSP